MSSETLLQLMEVPPANLFPSADMATPAAADVASQPAAPDAEPDATAAHRALPAHERRTLVARDINAKIEGLEKDIAGLCRSIAGDQAAVRDVMQDLQTRSATMMADIMRISSRFERDRQQHHEEHRLLDGRLTGSVSELGRELDGVDALLQAQRDGLSRLQDCHDTLQRLHVNLEKVVSRQGQSLGILATDTHQQLQLARHQIDDLHRLHREQEEALLALSSDHELLALKSGQLAARVSGIDSVLNENIGQTRRRFRTLALVVATLAAVSLGLITYFQLFPSAVPDTVRQQLAGLAAGLSLQSDSSAALRAELASLQGRMAGLDARLEAQAAEIASLRNQSRQTSRNLQDIRSELAAFKAELEAIDEETGTDFAAAIPAPVAIPGTRPDL